MMEGVTARGGVARRASEAVQSDAGSTTTTRVSIEGHTDLAYSDDPLKRFDGYGWQTLRVKDANDAAALEGDPALVEAKSIDDAPTLIVVDSVIGYGSPQ
jgi:transketolase